MAAEEGEGEDDTTKDSKRGDAPAKLRYVPASNKLYFRVPFFEVAFVALIVQKIFRVWHCIKIKLMFSKCA